MLPGRSAGSLRNPCRIANFDIATGEILPAGSKLLKLRSGNGLWHIDSSFKVLPALASLMCGVVVPEPGAGGETEFASSRAALAALPDDLEPAELSRLICVHDFGYSLRLLRQKAPGTRRLPPSRHFLVRRTAKGRSFFTGKHCSHVEGLSTASGRRLVRRINSHITQPQFIYRHVWSPGDVVLCDNRSCLHRGRPWTLPHKTRRMIQLVKIAEGRNEIAAGLRDSHALLRRLQLHPGAVAEAAPSILEEEALQMLEAVGWQEGWETRRSRGGCGQLMN
ncbi:unnamed protein product [Effrenium voratum]|nr:unnamed protein product [Effrenium voratum]